MSFGGDSEPAGLQGKTSQESALLSRGRQDYQRYRNYGRKAENAFIEEADQLGSPEKRRRMSDMAESTVAQEFAQNRPAYQKGSGMAEGIVAQGMNMGAAGGAAAAQSGLDVEQQYRAGQEAIIGMGRNLATDSLEGMNTAAQIAAAKQRAASAAAQTREESSNQLLGAGIGALGYGLVDFAQTDRNERGQGWF